MTWSWVLENPSLEQHGQASAVSSRHRQRRARLVLVRVLIVATVVLGANYLGWRWLFSVNWTAWPVAVPLVLAETYTLVNGVLFGVTMWRMLERDPAPPPPRGATVDVFLTTTDEPVATVIATAVAARSIRHPHRTWILDDGDRPELARVAETAGVGYLTRSGDWRDLPRHATAGNLNTALFLTSGEFLLVLPADQIPDPEILHRTLGWFRDEQVALVQTPRSPTLGGADPWETSPLSAGAIQQGKDGWGAAFFCGSNAVVRRSALMQIGVVGYPKDVREAVREILSAADRILRSARLGPDDRPGVATALSALRVAVQAARQELTAGRRIADVTSRFQRRVKEATRAVEAEDQQATWPGLPERTQLPIETDYELGLPVIDQPALNALVERGMSPLTALRHVHQLGKAIDVDRGENLDAGRPHAALSVTDDVATAIRLHSHGWRTVHHDEVLARRRAPQDLDTWWRERTRWAAGSLHSLLRQNPLRQPGLSRPQRLVYLATMWRFLVGFAAVVYLGVPVVHLLRGPSALIGYDGFLAHLLPLLIAYQLLFLVVGRRARSWPLRGLGLFPLWIRVCATAVGADWSAQPRVLASTPARRRRPAPAWRVVLPQLIAASLLVLAAVVGVVRLSMGQAPVLATSVHLAWVVVDLLGLGGVLRAALPRAAPGAEQLDWDAADAA